MSATSFDLTRLRQGLKPFKRRVVVLNPSDGAHSVRIPVPGGPGSRPYAVRFTTTPGAPVRVQQDGQALLVEIAARTGLVLAAP